MSDDQRPLSEEDIQELRRAYNAIKAFQEEKKSIAEDIREEKVQCSKKIGLPVKMINGIFKMIASRENGDYDDSYLRIAKAVEGISNPPSV